MSLTLTDRVGRLNDVLVSVNLLNWDARVMMQCGHQYPSFQGSIVQTLIWPRNSAWSVTAAKSSGRWICASTVGLPSSSGRRSASPFA